MGLSSNTEHALNAGFIGFMHQGALHQVLLPLGRLLGEDVAVVSLVTLYFTGSGHLESLLGAGVGFHLWHGAEKLEPQRYLFILHFHKPGSNLFKDRMLCSCN